MDRGAPLGDAWGGAGRGGGCTPSCVRSQGRSFRCTHACLAPCVRRSPCGEGTPHPSTPPPLTHTRRRSQYRPLPLVLPGPTAPPHARTRGSAPWGPPPPSAPFPLARHCGQTRTFAHVHSPFTHTRLRALSPTHARLSTFAHPHPDRCAAPLACAWLCLRPGALATHALGHSHLPVPLMCTGVHTRPDSCIGPPNN